MRFFAVLTAHFAAALTIYDNSGQLQTDGYPTSFSKTESWKFRTSGAQTYYLRFDDIHIDPECRSWISVYNDRTIGLPVWSLCDSDTGKTYQVYTDRITVTVNKAYSASGDGKRGVQFSYSVNEGFDQTTTTQSSTQATDIFSDFYHNFILILSSHLVALNCKIFRRKMSVLVLQLKVPLVKVRRRSLHRLCPRQRRRQREQRVHGPRQAQAGLTLRDILRRLRTLNTEVPTFPSTTRSTKANAETSSPPPKFLTLTMSHTIFTHEESIRSKTLVVNMW